MTGVLNKGGRLDAEADTHGTDTGRRPCADGGKIMLPQAKEGQGLPRAARVGRGKEGLFPGACGGSRAPRTPPFGIPSFQSCERIHFHCFKPAGTERNIAPHHSNAFSRLPGKSAAARCAQCGSYVKHLQAFPERRSAPSWAQSRLRAPKGERPSK